MYEFGKRLSHVMLTKNAINFFEGTLIPIAIPSDSMIEYMKLNESK